MISYNPKNWFTFIFRFHEADTFRKLFPLIIGICVYSWLVTFAEIEFLRLSKESFVKNISLVHSLLGFVISILLVFRTNTAYDRWWEGRKLWGGLVNNSRNLALKLSAMLSKDDEENRSFFRKTIPAYAFALRDHLRSEKTRTEIFDRDTHEHILKQIDRQKHIPNQVAGMIYERVQQLYKEGKITGEQLIFLNTELSSFTDICGACERIKNTPIPFSYSVFIKKFIFFYIMTLPLGHVFDLGYLIIPVVAFVFYVMASLELIAEEIEDPFGGDPNDVPTDKISDNIQNSISELI